MFQLLTQDPRLSSIVGKRVFYQTLPENTSLPAIVFNAVASESEFTLDGPDPLTAKHFQFDSYAKQPLDARNLSNAVRSIVEGFSGGLPDGTQVQSAIISLDLDMPYEVGTGPSGLVYRCLLNAEIAYTSI